MDAEVGHAGELLRICRTMIGVSIHPSTRSVALGHKGKWLSLNLLTRPLNTVRPELVEGHAAKGFDKLSPNGIPVINRAGLIMVLRGGLA